MENCDRKDEASATENLSLSFPIWKSAVDWVIGLNKLYPEPMPPEKFRARIREAYNDKIARCKTQKDLHRLTAYYIRMGWVPKMSDLKESAIFLWNHQKVEKDRKARSR